MLHKAFGDAVRSGLLAKNPADGANRPSLRQATADSRCDRPVWTAKQLYKFLSAVEHGALYPLWLLAAMTGMRRSEVLGAAWHTVSECPSHRRGAATVQHERRAATVGAQDRAQHPHHRPGRPHRVGAAPAA